MILNSNHLNNIEDGIVNISNELNNFINVIYPVGTIYTSSNSTSPASLFGGTWTQLKDRVIVGAGGSYAVNSTGGEAEHTLTTNEAPSHSHTVLGYSTNYNAGVSIPAGYAYAAGLKEGTTSGGLWGYMRTASSAVYENTKLGVANNTGGGKAHNNMPPYIAKYMWERVG